jgi:hypothetical protein
MVGTVARQEPHPEWCAEGIQNGGWPGLKLTGPRPGRACLNRMYAKNRTFLAQNSKNCGQKI